MGPLPLRVYTLQIYSVFRKVPGPMSNIILKFVNRKSTRWKGTDMLLEGKETRGTLLAVLSWWERWEGTWAGLAVEHKLSDHIERDRKVFLF